MTSRILVSLRVAATPVRAFDVFVREIGAWWRPNGLFRFTPGTPGTLAFEPWPGGRFTETLASGEVYEIGHITRWEPGARLGFTWRQAMFAPEQITEVEVRFEEASGETRVTVEHRGWERVPQDHVARHHFPEAIFLQRHAEWWQTLLRSFQGQIGSDLGHATSLKPAG